LEFNPNFNFDSYLSAFVSYELDYLENKTKKTHIEFLTIENNLNKLIYILFFALTISSCYSEKDFNGTWIGQYSNDTIFNKDITGSHIIITFKNGTYHSEDIYGNSSIGEFDLFFNKIILDEKEDDYGIINKLTSDSLVLKEKNQKESLIIYKKLSDSLKYNSSNKITLNGKSFTLKFNNKIDTLSFINDTILTRAYSNSKAYWKRIKIDGFEIILIDGYSEPPLIIREQTDNKIIITLFFKKNINLELEEIK